MGSSSSCASPPNTKRGTQATSHTAFSASAPPTNSTASVSSPPTSCIVLVVTHDHYCSHPTTALPADSPGSLRHFTNEGWLTPVVNPNGYSPEPGARAFVVVMRAAYRAWAAMAASQTNQWKQGFCENERQRWSAEVFNKCWDNFYVGYFDAEIRMFTHSGVATNHIYNDAHLLS